MGDLSRYFALVCLPAAAIAAGALHFLSLQSARIDERAEETFRARAESLAAELQDAVREARPDGRDAALAAWTSTNANARAIARFVWTPGAGARPLAGTVPESVRSFTKWNEWTSPGRRSARRGLAPGSILWARVDDAVRAVEFDGEPVKRERPVPLWPAGLAIVALLAGTVAAGGSLLWRAAARARRDDAEKTGFLSNVSHELKTPLAAIGLWGGMLKNGRLEDPERIARAYDVIVRENERMLRMVGELLEFARFARAASKTRRERVNLAGIVRERAGSLAPGFTGGLSVSAPERSIVLGDAEAIGRIVANLLENAARHAPGSPVEVTVREDGDFTALDTADRGPGMSPEAMKRCFERFYRADDALGAKTGGLGLGLALSRSLAREMGGGLSVRAREGGGVVFTARFRRADG